MPWTIKRMYPSGIYVDMLKPEEAQLDIVDIAWSLSMQCRFDRCCARHYSVAEHSMFVAAHVPREFAFEDLLHDAHEAYAQDINTGFKQALEPAFKELDNRWRLSVCRTFDLPEKISPEIHHADMVALATERRDLELLDSKQWPSIVGIEPAPAQINHLSQYTAYQTFLNYFTEYGGAWSG